MVELPHTLVGAAIASQIPDPLISLPLAFASHFVLDLIPHWDPPIYSETKKTGKPTTKTNRIVFIDTLLSLSIGLFLASRFLPDFKHALTVVFSCFAAVSVDVLEAPYYYLNFRPKLLKRMIDFLHGLQVKAPFLPGIITQLTVILVSFLVIFL